ncbi:MAG: hypothetical protein LBU20_00060 [Candidatus Nomurabacteria bacterium]|nr:hypothetical protein [Candidatus Nomurabacteria bacterium]
MKGTRAVISREPVEERYVVFFTTPSRTTRESALKINQVSRRVVAEVGW